MAGLRGMKGGSRIAAMIAAGLVAVIVLLFAVRDRVLETIAEAYFAGTGTKASVTVSGWDRTGVTARVTLGDHAEVTADRVTVRFNPHALLPHVESVEIDGVRLRLLYDGHSLSFGSLQALVDSLGKPRTRSWTDDYIRAPLPVSLTNAEVVLDTPAGAVRIAGSASVTGSQILSADAQIIPAELRLRDMVLHVDGGRLAARARQDGLRIDGDIHISGTHGLSHQDLLHLDGVLHGEGVAWTSQGAATQFFARTLKLDARGSGRAGLLTANEATLRAQASNVEARRENGRLALGSRITASLSLPSATVGTVPLRPSRFDLDGNAMLGDGGARLDAHLSGGGGFSETALRAVLGPLPILSSEPRLADAIARAAATFRTVSRLRVATSSGHLTIALSEPAQFASASGASLTLAQPSGAGGLVVFGRDGIAGGGTVSLAGGDLPAMNLALAHFSLGNDSARTIDAAFRTTATITTRVVRTLSIAASGHAAGSGGSLAVRLDNCASVRVAALLMRGRSEISDASGTLCGVGTRPIFASRQDQWRFDAALGAVSAKFPSANASLRQGSGSLSLAGDSSGLRGGSATMSRASLFDLPPGGRFAPLLASGRARYDSGQWKAQAVVETTAHRTKLGTVTATVDPASGTGHVLIEATNIRFAPGKLAPSDISPLLGTLARADGAASFRGQIAWTRAGLTSGGTLDTDELKFASPMGNASGTATHIRFVSLLPPETAVGQPFSVGRVEWLSPINGVAARFRLTPQLVELAGVDAKVAGGTARLDPLTITLGPKRKIAATLKLSQIDLGKLLADSNLAGKVHLDASVSGTIPFTIGDEGIRITDGVIASTKPGRISIDRSLWTSGTLSSNAMQDFAYQALENLAFDTLQGRINSLPKGRLGIVLHIQGHSDPPGQSEARVGLFDLLRGKAFNKAIPLPKGTPIDLTLDTSLNFDELLRAYQDARSPTISAK